MTDESALVRAAEAMEVVEVNPRQEPPQPHNDQDDDEDATQDPTSEIG